MYEIKMTLGFIFLAIIIYIFQDFIIFGELSFNNSAVISLLVFTAFHFLHIHVRTKKQADIAKRIFIIAKECGFKLNTLHNEGYGREYELTKEFENSRINLRVKPGRAYFFMHFNDFREMEVYNFNDGFVPSRDDFNIIDKYALGERSSMPDWMFVNRKKK